MSSLWATTKHGGESDYSDTDFDDEDRVASECLLDENKLEEMNQIQYEKTLRYLQTISRESEATDKTDLTSLDSISSDVLPAEAAIISSTSEFQDNHESVTGSNIVNYRKRNCNTFNEVDVVTDERTEIVADSSEYGGHFCNNGNPNAAQESFQDRGDR